MLTQVWGVAGAVISNHCSYIDILILMSRYFPSFVARSNTQEMPLIGLCRCATHLHAFAAVPLIPLPFTAGRLTLCLPVQ